MSDALTENLFRGPVDSLEVRWVVAGPPGMAMRGWFSRFPARTERREDTYLLQPPLPRLSVKLRDGSALEVKAYLGSPGILDLPGQGRGRLEHWRKWSFSYDPPDIADAAHAGWVVVRKHRRRAWFPLGASQDPVPAPQPADQPGCTVELVEVHTSGQPWWSVGIEATGSASLLGDALQHAVDLVFAQPLPAGTELSLDHSQSYAQWLSQRHRGVPKRA